MHRTAALLAFCGVFSFGCTEYEVHEDDGGIDDLNSNAVPDIVVTPTEVNFGPVDVNDTSEHVEVVEISNVGDADLHIQNIELQDIDAPFAISNIQSVLVTPEGVTQFEVTYTPATAATADTYVLIDSDDPDTPVEQVHLLGEGLAPVIEVDPVSYDFGTIWVGCENELPITISNVGNADLVVYDFEYNTGSNDLIFGDVEDSNGEKEEGVLTLGASAYEEVYVSYLPLDEYDDVAYLKVVSNDPLTPEVQVSQEGAALYYGSNLDVFEQPIQGSTDIIFAADKSGSMSDNNANVANNFGVFVETMAGLDADFHVAVTVSDNGCINGSSVWIDNSFSESEAVTTVQEMFNGSSGSNTERAFMLMEACLAETGTGGCNEGLVRDDAALNLIGVSDEPEQSSNDYSYYIALFQSYKDDPDDVVIHAIGGDYPGGCGGGSAAAYTGMYEATVATGGEFLSICATDWASHLETLAEGSAAVLDSFALTATPVPQTLVVRVDGVQSTLGWAYEEDINSVVFDHEYIPDGGSTIEIEYALYGDCDG